MNLLKKIPVSFLGPFFLFCTLGLACQNALDLFLIAVVGFALCSHWQVRGCAYALALLGLGSVLKHSLLDVHHLWELGLEGSLACAFLIMGLTGEQSSSFLQSLHQQIEAKGSAVKNLEEELHKERESAVTQQIASQEKLDRVQKELEELQADHSSILILNEVLRQTTARESREKELLWQETDGEKQKSLLLQQEFKLAQDELARIKNSEQLVIENRNLLSELNTARSEKEQTHLINEALARFHARESLKAKEAIQEKLLLEQKLQEEERVRQEEVSLLKQQLEEALRQLVELQEPPVVEVDSSEIKQQLANAEEKIEQLREIEDLYKQLKKQFAEKSETLHQTRVQLFKLETELEAQELAKVQADLNPLPLQLYLEVDQLDQEATALEQENRGLEELITALLEQFRREPSEAVRRTAEQASRKKKVKIQSLLTQQELLF